MDEGFSIKFRFNSLAEGSEWFRQVRALDLVPQESGLRLQELSDTLGPDDDTRLIVADRPADQHPWIVRPGVPVQQVKE